MDNKYIDDVKKLYDMVLQNIPPKKIVKLFKKIICNINTYQDANLLGCEVLKYDFTLELLDAIFNQDNYNYSISLDVSNWLVLMFINKYPKLDKRLLSWFCDEDEYEHNLKYTAKFLGLHEYDSGMTIIIGTYLLYHHDALTKKMSSIMTYPNYDIVPLVNNILDKKITSVDDLHEYKYNKYYGKSIITDIDTLQVVKDLQSLGY